MKQKHFIDTHKGATAFVVLLLMALYQQWHNPTAWVYLALHGSYGWLWVLKSWHFPDRQWQQPTTLWYGLVIWGGLTLYWIAPWLITSQGVMVPAWYLGMCIALYTCGVFFHFTSDMQKYISLKLRPNQLVQEGIWAYVRNPNYFGELLIYLGFGLLARHWLPLLVILLFVAVVWLPNMFKKDRSLARYPEFASYKTRTKLLIPFVL
jgi:protein-S-isoprenylcysteine O-methyltransferase Ste14